MSPSETIVISRLQIPPKAVASRGPEHEVSGQFCREQIFRLSALSEMSPLRSHAQHELGFLREVPGFLKQKIRVPFRRVTCVEGRNACLQF